MIRHITLLFLWLLLLSQGASAQQADQPADTLSIDGFVRKASLARREYIEAFKDLNAEETQRVEEYDDKGVKRRREIVSDLIIYQSPLDAVSVVEYRNVRIVDGEAVSGRDSRAEKLFARLAKASSLKQELERIDRESRRYDLNSSFGGFTLHQGLPLDERFIGSFRFTVTSTEQIDGHDVTVVDYRQTAPLPGQSYKLSPPAKLKGAEAVYRGRLWIDGDRFQLRRELREWTITHVSLKTPLVFVKNNFEYSDSKFGILTPTKITMSSYTRGRDKPDGTSELLIGNMVTYTYGPFRRFEVTPEFKPSQ